MVPKINPPLGLQWDFFEFDNFIEWNFWKYLVKAIVFFEYDWINVLAPLWIVSTVALGTRRQIS